MVVRHSGFGNVGRDKNENKSSNGLDLHALTALRDAMPSEKSAVFLCEINEGDDNNEMKLVRQLFKGWRLYGRNTREPILLSPDNPPAEARTYWVSNTAVAHWSPPRSVLVVHLADEPVSLMGSHPAAGANGQGDRPRIARPLLQTSWERTTNKRRLIKNRLHHANRNIIEMLDANAYVHSIQKQPDREKVVFSHATDWGLVLPAKGYTTNFDYKRRVDFRIDSHDGHIMEGSF